MKAIVQTGFSLPGQVGKYVGKVRDVYDINGDYLAMVVTDRISAFDVVLPEGIPYKGQVLNKIAAKFLDATSDILPNWKVAVPDPRDGDQGISRRSRLEGVQGREEDPLRSPASGRHG